MAPSRPPAWRSASRVLEMMGRPPTSTRGLGVLAVCAPRRPPSPAASTTALTEPSRGNSTLLYYGAHAVSPVGPADGRMEFRGSTGRRQNEWGEIAHVEENRMALAGVRGVHRHADHALDHRAQGLRFGRPRETARAPAPHGAR